ncbi:MAG: DUF2088 domain-containing protein, partial [Bdellovibrionales bacterium]|nr:DUF2088 domain-containing protein [Bdellovibrionales bacterium]
MQSQFIGNSNAPLTTTEISDLTNTSLRHFDTLTRVLIVHPDDTRKDFSHLLIPQIAEELFTHHGTQHLDTLSASGVHNTLSEIELRTKTGLTSEHYSDRVNLYSHNVNNTEELIDLDPISGEFLRATTNDYITQPVPLRLNSLLFDPYDLIITLSGTVPHEAVGFSGGTKIFLPGVAGREIIGVFHWAAAMVGVPNIIGTLNNPARRIIDEGASQILERISATPVLSFDMVYSEDTAHNVLPYGLGVGEGLQGFRESLKSAASLSAILHIRHVPRPQQV